MYFCSGWTASCLTEKRRVRKVGRAPTSTEVEVVESSLGWAVSYRSENNLQKVQQKLTSATADAENVALLTEST
jgi:hypothetical protein